jgi:hypothetical protein
MKPNEFQRPWLNVRETRGGGVGGGGLLALHGRGGRMEDLANQGWEVVGLGGWGSVAPGEG